MPVWAQWVTFGTAMLAAVLGIANFVMSYIRGARFVRIGIQIEPFEGLPRRLIVQVINRGRVPVRIADIRIASRGGRKAKTYPLWVEYGDGFNNAVLEQGAALFFRINPESLNKPLDAGADLIQVTTADQRVYSARFRELLAHKDELQCEVIDASKPWEGRVLALRGRAEE